jgi:hypothetical protein
VCDDCSEKLLICYEFKKRSWEIERKIQEYVRAEPGRSKELVVEKMEIEEEQYLEEVLEPELEPEPEEPQEPPSLQPDPDPKRIYLIYDESSKNRTNEEAPFLFTEKTKDGEKYICPICPNSVKFISRKTLKRHFRIHCQDKRYKCPECDLSFIHSTSREQHILLRHCTKADWKFNCQFCDEKFYRKDKMNVHIKKKHTLEYNFHCTIPDCRARFVENSALKKHLKTHSSEKTFVCPFCPNKYKLKKNLIYHLKSHDEEGEAYIEKITGKKLAEMEEEACEKMEKPEMVSFDLFIFSGF